MNEQQEHNKTVDDYIKKSQEREDALRHALNDALAECLRLCGSEARLVEALERLATMEAFTMSRVIDKERDNELLARIGFARAVLAKVKP